MRHLQSLVFAIFGTSIIVLFSERSLCEDTKQPTAATTRTIAYLRTQGVRIFPYLEDSDLPDAKGSGELVVHVTDTDTNYDSGWSGSDGDLQMIATIPNVTRMRLDFALKDDQSLRFLGKMKDLKELTLGANTINDTRMKYVEECPHLETLSGIAGISDVGMLHVMKLKRLKVLDWSAAVTGNGIVGIEGMESLKTLLSDNSRITDRSLRNICKLPRLANLDVSATQISDDGIDELAKCNELRSLNVRNTKITPAGLKRLRDAMPHCNVMDDFP